MRRLATAMLVWSAAAGATEVLQGIGFRAVTLEPGQAKSFRVPTLERVTGSSGPCVEEVIDTDADETFTLTAICSGVHTALVWRADGKRILVMACAEDEKNRPAALVKLRQKLQLELKGSKQQTACVRNGRVELWGWASSAADKARLDALETKYGEGQVRNFVELLEAEE